MNRTQIKIENWTEYSFEEIFQELKVKNKSEEPFPVLSVTQGNGIILQSDKYKKEIASEDKSGYKIAPLNSIIFNPNYLNFGAIGVQDKVENGLVSSIYGVLELKRQDLIDFNYLRHLIRSKFMIHKYNKYANGSSKVVLTGELNGMHVRLAVSIQDFKKIKISFPTLKEQQKIAQILSAVDEQIEKTEQLIEKSKELKEGLVQRLFIKGINNSKFKKTEIGELPYDWKTYFVEEVATVSTGNKDTQDKITDGKFDFYVRSQKIEKIDSYSFEGEAILTAGDGVGVGKVFHYIPEGKFDFHQRVYKISNFKDVLGKYFFYYFSKNFIKQARKFNAKTSVDSVRREMITKMIIPLPPIHEQKEIAEILSSADEQIKAYEKEKEKQNELKKVLMQQLLTGKIRVTV